MKTQRLEKYSERFDNKDNEIVQGIFNPENWGKRMVEEPKQETTLEEDKDLAYYKANAEEDYLSVPISVLRYISQLEQQERSYSEEEVSDLLKCLRIELNINKELIDIDKWFEQFKNK